jgi:dGTPase
MKPEPPWIDRRSDSPINRPKDTRDPYVRDRARMIHSASFRRLQAKTQVLGVGESDFYRTRLTHSLEVAQIGSGIVKHLRKKDKEKNKIWEEYLPPESLIETICLAHDIGHPPFGHGGEVALNFMMRNHGGFEGNGQTLRILSQLDKYTELHGMDLTRRVMLGSVKYPEIYSKVFSEKHQCNCLKEEDLNNPRKVKAGDWKPPKCIFDEDEYILEWILEPFNVEDQELFREIEKSDEITKHNKPINKSFDTSIMDLSDDIAYGIHDLEDALALRIITRDSWDNEVVCKLNNLGTSFGYKDMDTISNDLFSKETYERKSVIGGLVNWFVTSIYVDENEKFEHPFLKYNAKFSEQNKEALSILKNT